MGEPAKLRFTLCSTGLEVGGVHRGERPSWHGSTSSLVTGTAESARGRAAPTSLLEACSAGLLVLPFSEGLSVLLDNPRCSTGLEVGGVHRGDRPSWHGSASSLVTFTGTAASVRGRAAACLEACSTGLEVGGVHRGERPS